LDFFFMRDDIGVNLQMDKHGRIFGIPEGMNPEKVQALMEAACKVLLGYAKKRLDLFGETSKLKQQMFPPRRSPQNPQLASVTNEPERVVSIQVPRPLKKKEQRRLGLLPGFSGADEIRIGVSERAKPKKLYEITFTEEFREELADLPQAVREQANEAVHAIEWGEKQLRPLTMREVDTNICAIRIGKYRIAFAQTGSVKLAAIKIDKRSDVYRDLAHQIEDILAKLR